MVRLKWRSAVAEYAVAPTGELAEQCLVPGKALYDVRKILDRVPCRLTDPYAAR